MKIKQTKQEKQKHKNTKHHTMKQIFESHQRRIIYRTFDNGKVYAIRVEVLPFNIFNY